MLSRQDFISFADTPPRLAPPRFRLTADESSALNAALRAIDRICRDGEDRDADQETGASLIGQLAAAERRRAALAPAVDEAIVAREGLAAAGLELSVRGGHLVVSRRRSIAAQVPFERARAE